MRSHAKASTAGSTQRQAKGLGRIFRGAFATRGASRDSKGSGAPAIRRVVLPLSLFAAIVALMVAAIPASATKTHLFEETFGSAAQPSFGNAQGIAVDQSTGDVLVMDGGAGTVSRYNPDGTPANFSALATNVIDGQGSGDETPQNGLSFSGASESQIAVDNSGTATDGDIYVTQGSPNVINIFSEAGEYLGQLSESSAGAFSEACGVAVDPSGAIYVGDYNSGIHKFAPAANPPVNADNSANFSSVTNPCVLAVGAGPSAGFLFAARFNGPISKLDSSSGEVKYVVSADENTTLSLDPSSGNVFAATESTIEELDASGVGSAASVSSFTLASPARGVALRGSSGEVYVSRLGRLVVEVFGPLVTLPDVTTVAASSVAETTATLNGTVNPDGVELDECKFEYGKTTSYGQSVPCAQSTATIGSGSSDVPVSADLSGLELGAEYHFRLVATNPDGTVDGLDESFKLESPPAIKGQWAQGVTFAEAEIKAKINPEGFASTFHFEWGATASYGQSTAEKAVGSDEADHTVGAFLEGLQPGTTYHYRVVATNSVGTTEGPDHTFTTYAHIAQDASCPNQAFRGGASATLPDCRAYEMVSPVDKNGGEIERGFNGDVQPSAGFYQAAPSGEKFTYSSSTSFGDQPSSQNSNQYMGTRGAAGWSSHGINPPITPLTVPFSVISPWALHRQYQAFSEDLSSGWLLNDNNVPITPNGIKGFANIYRRDNNTGSFEALTVNQPSKYREDEGYTDLTLELEFKGASADGSESIYEATAALTPDTASAQYNVYTFSKGEAHLVSVLPDGTASPVHSVVGQRNSGQGFYDTVDRAVSEDGSKVFWTSGSEYGPGTIYIRENPTQPQSAISGGECTEPAKACTIPVSESVTTGWSQFWTASTDGSKAVFKVTQEYDPLKGNLYEFDVETETPTLIAGKVDGVVGASEDLSYLYFVSKEALDAGATAGERNLYLDREGSIEFIATLSTADMGIEERGPHVATAEPAGRTSRVTPDGRHLAFMSTESLTGYDSTDAVGAEPKSFFTNTDFEVFVYDADSRQLICPSCNPSDARPLGKPYLKPFGTADIPIQTEAFKHFRTAAWIPPWDNEFHPSRVLSDDGSRLFFNSFDALVPQDTNGVQDVYQWEEQGSGSCEEPAGCISLISTGQSPTRSEVVDASADGDDVFIRTTSSIDPRDPGLYDIYDAREGGGYPIPSSPPACVGDACQSVPSAPNDPTPASAGFKGAGSPPAKKPRRRCTAKRRHASKAKGSSKRKHAKKRCTRSSRRVSR